MKKTTFIILLLIPFIAFSQAIQNNAPWMKNQLKSKKKLTINDISLSAENYFNTIDRDKKGSGLKPFKRWEYHWNHYTKSDGTIAPATDLWNAWEQKNNLNASQKNNANDTSNWTSLGPYSHTNTASWSSGQGRVNVIAVDPSNSSTYYVGAPAGGIWKSTDSGVNWEPLTDHLPQIGVSGIAIHPTDSNTIYIATGDDDAGDSYAIGVMKTTDGGLTWNNTGNITADSMNEIYIDPNNTNNVLVATDTGLYKTTNAGGSWSRKLGGNIIDLKMKPGDSSIWYAASSNNIYRSNNSGESFSTLSISGFSNSSRIALEVTPANSNYVYFVSSDSSNEFNGVYKSTNSGVSFTKTSETDDIFGSTQAWYDLALTVSDTNENTVYVGVLNIWKSINGGDNFTKMNNWSSPTADSYTHADIHFMRFINGRFFAGTDGGVYVSSNHGTKFTDLTENLAISQFYKISVAQQNSGNIVGGLQDNGGYAYKDDKWSNYFGADGMDCAVNILNPNNYFGFIQYGGQLYETTDGGLTRKNGVSAPSDETGTGDSGGRWVTPMVSNSKGEIYAGYSQLYKLAGGNWVKVSNHGFGGDLYHIEIDPNNDNNIYVTRGTGLYKSTDAGVTFTKIVFPPALQLILNLNSIEVSNNESDVAWITTNLGVYKTTNLLSSTPVFTNITGNLPTESKIVLRHHPGHKDNRIYLGTTLGVYYIDDTLAQWQTFDNKLPNVAVRDLEINEKDSKLYAATYGRGVFMTDITKSLPLNDVKLVSVDSPINNSKSCGSVSPVITVKNQGSNSITAISVTYSTDGGSNTVFNWSGTLASEATTQITIPQFNLSKGGHVINIEATISNDLYSSNNKSSSSFNITELNATPTTTNSFENIGDELIVETSGNSGNNLWQRGAPNKTLLNSAGTGTNAYVTGLVGNHPDNTTSYLYTKCYDLTLVTNPVLSFKMAFDIENNWDHMYVEYTTDQGETWSILGTASDANWYNSSATTDSSGQSSLPGKQWTGEGEKSNSLGGTNATVHNYSYDLAAFTNESGVLFRFKFIADAAANEEGAMVDDLVITGVLPVDEYDEIGGLSIFPNPSNSIFNINWAQGNDFSISVFDLTGKLLLQEKGDSKSLRKFSLDMSEFSKGIYFAKIKVDEKQSTKKLILK